MMNIDIYLYKLVKISIFQLPLIRLASPNANAS
jgi:hypothetical protein